MNFFLFSREVHQENLGASETAAVREHLPADKHLEPVLETSLGFDLPEDEHRKTRIIY